MSNPIVLFFQLIRWPNLLIVGLTQFFIQYLVLIPAFQKANLIPSLVGMHFLLLVICTICIAAAGYVINDIIDEPIDKINKPDKVIIGKHFAVETGYKLYYGVLMVGLAIAIYLATYVGNLGLTFLYVFANTLLFLYSKYFKQQALIGNIVVSVFCAFVAGIVLFAEREGFMALNSNGFGDISQLCYGYLLFAFLSTMFREIVKDIEDIEGDKEKNCKTLPIVIGIQPSKYIAILFAVILLSLTISWFTLQLGSDKLFALIYLGVGIIAPIFVAIIYLFIAQRKEALGRISSLAKYIMVSGIFYLLILFL